MAVTHHAGPMEFYGDGGTPEGARSTVTSAVFSTITPTANANTDSTVALPVGFRLLRLTVQTTTAFTGATATLQVGSAAGGAQYAAATDIKAVGSYTLTLTGAALTAVNAAGGVLYVRLAQTTPTAVGSARLIIEGW